MRRETFLIAATVLLVLLFAGCAGLEGPSGAGAESGEAAANGGEAAAGEKEAQEASAEGGEKAAGEEKAEGGWTLELVGAVEETVSQSRFEAAKEHSSHYREIEVEEKGETVTYRGMPLWYFIAMVDDGEEDHPYDLDDEQWKEGYDITFTAEDGYSATLNTAEVGREAVSVAYEKNGEPIKPRIVGDVSTSLWVKDLASIEAFVEPPEPDKERASFELELQVNDKTHSFTLSELEGDPQYMEGPGSYTTSAGTTYSHTYGGIRLAEFLSRYIKLKPDSTIKFVAMDGYEMTYNSKEVLEPGKGEWILAFKRNGEYLPKDPGYIRTVKVGEEEPNILGHKSVKMIKRIEMQ